MFLKNNSKFKIGFKTKKETLSILPNDCIKVFEKDIIKLSAKLIEITEEEYKEWLSSKTEEIKSTEEVDKDNKSAVNEDETQSTETEKAEVKTTETEETEVKTTEEEKDITTDETEKDVTTDETQSTEQVVEDEEIATLRNKLEELKNAWEQSSRPNKKASIQKQIVEVKEQLEKLTENK